MDPRDAGLRRSLDPEARAVERVVRGALSASPRRGMARVRWPAVAAAVVLVGLGVLAAIRGAGGPSTARISMVNVGEVVVVQRAEGGGHLLKSAEPVDPVRDGARHRSMIIRRGETR
jgi:hypothetical protein